MNIPMLIFLAGIMQGSHQGEQLHDQDYRTEIKLLLEEHLPEADVYDPRADHLDSIGYDASTGERVFFGHNRMCRSVDLLVAFVPEASMGTAIEMWEAHQHGAVTVTVSPMKHNWAVKFLSHILYADIDTFRAEVLNGRLVRRIETIQSGRSAH